MVDGKTDNQEIANTFADVYLLPANLSLELSKKNELQFLNKFKGYKGTRLLGNKELTNIEVLGSVICDLKPGKAVGLHNLSAEHLKFAHLIAWSILVRLINLI